MKGRLVALEGLDGAGTTTQAAALVRALLEQGVAAHGTQEPSSGPVGVLLRQALGRRLVLPGGQRLSGDTLALLFAADRLDHLAAEVEPLLAAGTWVVSDRYVLSSLAYQGPEVGLAWVAQLNARARPPDVTLFLDVPLRVARARRGQRALPEELFENQAAQARTRAGYLRAIAARRRRGDRVVVLDGTRPVEEVTRACLQAVLRVRRA